VDQVPDQLPGGLSGRVDRSELQKPVERRLTLPLVASPQPPGHDGGGPGRLRGEGQHYKGGEGVEAVRDLWESGGRSAPGDAPAETLEGG
jgi:hypothetical protein